MQCLFFEAKSGTFVGAGLDPPITYQQRNYYLVTETDNMPQKECSRIEH